MEPEISSEQTDKQAPIETLPPKPIWKSKFLWGFVAVSTIAAFLIGGFALGKNTSKKTASVPPSVIMKVTPTPDPTANWRTYEENGFSFKSPPDWSLKFQDGYNFVIFPPTSDPNLPSPAVFVSADSKTAYSSFKPHSTTTAPSKITVDGTSGIEYQDNGLPPLSYHVVLPLGSGILVLNSDLSLKTQAKQILSTFKFSKHPDAWQTYSKTDFGFTVTFPKTSMNYKCEDVLPRKYYDTPLKIFEDPSENSVYISTDEFTERKNYSFKNCTIVKNNLDLIKNGFLGGGSYGGQPTRSFPDLFKISFRKAVNDNDLTELLHSMYGPTTYITGKKLDVDMPGVYDVSFASTKTYAGGYEPNFVYYFYYNPKTQSAVITNGFQGTVFGVAPGTIPGSFPNEYSIQFTQ